MVDRDARSALRWLIDYLGFSSPFGKVMAAISDLARSSPHLEGRQARAFLKAFSERRSVLASTTAKLDVLQELVPAISAASRSLVFTETTADADRGAGLPQAARVPGGRPVLARPFHSGITDAARRDSLARFEQGRVDVLVAARVIDEGLDVHDADLAVILAASRSRRQMVQRMGRVLRPKAVGHLARFGIVFVKGTIEDPRSGAHEAFLDEIEPLADDRLARWEPANLPEAVAFLASAAARLDPKPPLVTRRPFDDLSGLATGGDKAAKDRGRSPIPRDGEATVFACSDDYATRRGARGAAYHLWNDCEVLLQRGNIVSIKVHRATLKNMVPCDACFEA